MIGETAAESRALLLACWQASEGSNLDKRFETLWYDRAYNDGFNAYHNCDHSRSPFHEETHPLEYKLWIAGWNDAEKDF